MRGSYSTPDVPANSATPSASNDGRFTFEWAVYSDTLTYTIDPSTFETPVIAAELAGTWLEVLTEFGRMEYSLTSGLLSFLRSMGTLPLTDDQKTAFALRDLRRAHLDLWELNMLASHREAKSDTAYRKVVHVFALLRRHEDDHPGTLHEQIADRLARQPRLWHHRNDGLPPLSEQETRAWRRWAYQKAKNALSQLSPIDRLRYLAENDLIDLLRVRYTKNRAHETYDEVYARRDTAPFTAFRWAVMLNAAARAESDNPSLILMEAVHGRVKQPPWQRLAYCGSPEIVEGFLCRFRLGLGFPDLVVDGR